jgi:hypothetical protein
VYAPEPDPRPQPDTLKQRIEVAIARAEQEQETLLAAAQKAEQRVQMLKALVPFAEDASAEEVLRALLKTPPPAVPKPQAVAPPPQAITERVQVTRQLVLVATQTFDGPFTVNDVVERMTNGARIDAVERQRVRSSIAQAMAVLHEHGEVVKDSQGIGRQQSVWRKVILGANANSRINGTLGTRAQVD